MIIFYTIFLKQLRTNNVLESKWYFFPFIFIVNKDSFYIIFSFIY